MSIFKNISERDRNTLKLASIFIVFVLFIFVIILPLKDSKDFYKKKVETRKKVASEIAAMSQRYKDLKELVSRYGSSENSRKDNFTLFSFLDKAAADSDLKEQIKAMKPSSVTKPDYIESTVIVELEDVTIDSLMKYMHIIESSEHNMRIKKVDIKPRYSDPGRMGVTLLISAIQNL